MNVRRFFMPKTGGKEDIPVVSFPYYHVCSKGTCKFLFDMRDYFDMDQYKKNQGEVKCPKCGFPAYPSRFITVCEDGHMDDFPWRWWVHHGETSCKEDMYLKSMGNTSSLAELRVECNCGARRVMSGAMQKEKFAGLCCSGNHPHRPGAKAKICKKSVIPSQRGASNVYFTVTRNAISIPPWTNPINDIMGAQRATIETLVEAMGEEAGLSFAYQKYFGDKYSYEDFKAAYDRLSQNIKEFTELKEMEYAAITHHEDVEYQHDVKYFKAEEVALSESLKEYISKEPIKSHLEDLLFFIENEGFIYSHQICKDEFSVPETVYSWGMQPAFDYLIGRKIYDVIKTGNNIDIEYTNGIYQMLSLIAIEEDEKLISEYSNIKLEESVLFDLICYTLANTSAGIASKYRDYVKQLMQYSEAEFREIANNIIIPVSKVDNHPLGGNLLDEFLRSFDKPAQRDIWWSIPTYLRNNYNASWRTYSEIDTSMIVLSDEEHYMGAPLILVWRLSSVDNDIRHDCRLKLTEWGINNPKKYLDLLLYCADINDEQIVEDIFAIAYGIALGKFVQKEYLEKLSSWIVENVYSEEGLFKYENSAIRYYCKGIVKIAISKGLCDAECENRISEKYIRKSSFMPAYKDSFNSKRLSGYGPIDYDLARYVLCDHLDRFFCSDYKTREYLKETADFIEQYKKEYDVDTLEPEGLIISIAYQYLLNQGWDKKTFWECEDKNNLGIDICIRHTHSPSTHGAMSRVMTVAEKYVWCVKHRMEAAFASQLQYNDYGQGIELKEIKPIRPNTYDDYELNIKILYGDAED